MCGIAGMVGPGAHPSVVARMTAVQRHRGPDGEGYFSTRGLALGHRRLKIIDLSDSGRQPMTTADGRYTLIYNGELYNYRELRTQLSGVSFHSTTDSEVLLEAFVR